MKKKMNKLHSMLTVNCKPLTAVCCPLTIYKKREEPSFLIAPLS